MFHTSDCRLYYVIIYLSLQFSVDRILESMSPYPCICPLSLSCSFVVPASRESMNEIPSQMAIYDTFFPVSLFSTTTLLPASANFLSSIMTRRAVRLVAEFYKQ